MRKDCLPRVLVLVALLSLLAWPAMAAEIHVDAANQTGIEDGSAAFPFDSLQKALDAAAASDTVLVAPGIYYGAIEMKSGVRLVGIAGPEVTIIDGMGASTVIQSPYADTPSSYLEGFTVRNGSVLLSATNRVSFWAWSTWNIVNCIFKDAVYVGMYVYPGAQMVLERSVMLNMPVGIDFIWSPPVILKHVTMDSISDGALKPYQAAAELYNSSFTNVASFVRLWGSRGSGSIYGRNNNVWNFEFFDVPSDGGSRAYFGLTGSLHVDPLFVDRAAGNYHLTAASPLIDAGADLGQVYTGAAPDIGAYEFGQRSPEAMVQDLAESYQDVPLAAFRNAAEQRMHALQNKLMAVLNKLEAAARATAPAEKRALYQECLDKLNNDILAKADGFYGGNPKNDWITTREEQERLYPRIMELITAISEDLVQL